MKKQILCGIAVLAIAAVAAFNVSNNIQINYVSGVSLVNIEALAEAEDISYKGTSAKCEETTTYEDYEAEGGWTWDVSANVWLFQGKVSHSTPPSYHKVTKTTKSTWDGCKQYGNSDCTSKPC